VPNQPAEEIDHPRKRRRLFLWAAGVGSSFVAGLLVLVLSKGFDLWVGHGSAAQTPVTASPASHTSSVSTTPATTSTTATTSAPPAEGRPAPSRNTPIQQQPPPAGPTLLNSGHATIVNVDGFDLDNGQKDGQNVPGMDVSPDSVVTLINAMSNGTPRMAVLPRSIPSSYARCQEIPRDSYVQQLTDIRLMHVGDHICVNTNQGRCGVMTLTQVPSDSVQYLDFDYTTWDTYCRRA
jgi:hypothetical protein